VPVTKQCNLVPVKEVISVTGKVSAGLVESDVVRTNRRAIAMMFVRLSVCLKRACIVIIRCILARI